MLLPREQLPMSCLRLLQGHSPGEVLGPIFWCWIQYVSRNLKAPMVMTPPSNAGGGSSVPSWRAKIPHTSQPENQNIKQKQSCSKFNKDFKKWVTVKNISLRLETSKRGRPNAPSRGSSQRDLDTPIPKELGLPFLEGEILGS